MGWPAPDGQSILISAANQALSRIARFARRDGKKRFRNGHMAGHSNPDQPFGFISSQVRAMSGSSANMVRLLIHGE
jgi:hypothetical protein